ncbi:ParB N-terminal domain-containing protein [uncultured Gimesia sp.]|uniref:ParB N-terminal domain-containing protein n=1 Tax=uncultured Gimesia sp. TaxID=1678688 RepID=UPI002627F038|nr:ParB N-terminal domain-containing protein [uncultured Gimesia sp.]
MKFKDRIKSFRRIQASQLKRNLKNWRIHTETQETVLRAILKEVGFASACLVRDCKNGTFEIIDGHLRADIAEEEKVPCLVLDVTKSEAEKILATFDTVTSMANTDQVALDTLMASVSTDSKDLQELLDSLSSVSPDILEKIEGEDESHLLTDSFSVLIDCKDEFEQIALLKRLKKEGFVCRSWIS